MIQSSVPSDDHLRLLATFLLLASLLDWRMGGKSSSPSVANLTLRRAAEGHKIKIGAATNSPHLSEGKYAAILGSEFSQLTAENELKFATAQPTASTYDYTGGDALVAFAQAHQMAVRGHTFVWHKQVPSWLTSGNFTSAQLSDILKSHITHEMSHFGGKIYAWDVVNEAFNEDGTMRSTVWYDQPGIGFAGKGTKYIEQALIWAHAADPKAQLFYNDYDAEPVNAKSDTIYAMAKDFKKRRVPLDGIGFQFHVDLAFDNPNTLTSVASNLQRFAALGLEIHITELDVRLTDSAVASLNAQAKLYGEIAALCVQQSACKVLQTWGFTDKYSWIPQFYPGKGWALPWDADYKKKPAYDSVMKALQ